MQYRYIIEPSQLIASILEIAPHYNVTLFYWLFIVWRHFVTSKLQKQNPAEFCYAMPA